MEECRPGQFFWNIIKKYVLVILFLKFIINLDFLNDNQELVDAYISLSVSYYLIFKNISFRTGYYLAFGELKVFGTSSFTFYLRLSFWLQLWARTTMKS